MYQNLNRIIIALFTSAILASCSKNDMQEPDPTAGLTKIASGFAEGAASKVELYAKTSSLNTGYNRLWIALYDSASNQRIEDAHVKLMPMMDMGSMKHSAPFENPVSEMAVNHLFPAAVMFIMPGTGGQWTLKLDVHNHAVDKYGSITLPLQVLEPAKPRMKSFTSAVDGSKFFVGLSEPSAPKVGVNDFELVVFRRASMMSFPADSSLTIAFEPEMPTMGHGSPNNVNPVHTKNGHYRGKVNFTMTGLWRLNMEFKAGTVIADGSQAFDIEF